MRRERLTVRAADDAVVTLAASLRFDATPLRVRYATRTGALLRIDGRVAGAFDAKHPVCDLPALSGSHDVTLEVERRSLPVAGLPPGDGWRWRLMLARACETPARALTIEPRPLQIGDGDAAPPAAFGHAHLDVAWLWTYAETKRKALRTFATALRQIEGGRYVFAQSQPQLARWVADADPDFFARVRAAAPSGFDPSVATMWVEPDLHAPSGESILRQFAYGMRATFDAFGCDPTVVWLPDTFGFPSTLPTLAVHAGATAFATTKLAWNDTTVWPHPQFVWEGADGSRLTSAMIASYVGDPTRARAATARRRGEPLVVGYGDGGGGATDAAVARVAADRWMTAARWFASLQPAALPVHRGELYLETHRGTYTTHRDVKARNAALERSLAEAEEAVAWCIAVRAPSSIVRPFVDDLRNAWTIVLRNQFHDVIAGTSIGAVYADVHAEYDRADRIAARVLDGARSVLPRSDFRPAEPPSLAPERDADGRYVFANADVRAVVRPDGSIVELAATGGPNVAGVVNGLVAYVDRPARWDAWNIDAGYERRRRRVRAESAALEDDGLVVRLQIGRRSRAAMRIDVRAGEPFVRVELAVDWREDHVLLRAEHRFAVDVERVRFGQPHGSLERSAVARSAADRARFEVPAQRFAHADDGTRGVAVLAADTYGWSVRRLPRGGVAIGTSLLRAPRWPDPDADRGERRIAYAFAPTAGAPVSALEAAWSDYVETPRVRLFTCDEAGVLVVATKPADDGDGVIVRVRECDGLAHDAVVRCGGRMRAANATDACERPADGTVVIDGDALLFALAPYALRTFRVRF